MTPFTKMTTVAWTCSNSRIRSKLCLPTKRRERLRQRKLAREQNKTGYSSLMAQSRINSWSCCMISIGPNKSGKRLPSGKTLPVSTWQTWISKQTTISSQLLLLQHSSSERTRDNSTLYLLGWGSRSSSQLSLPLSRRHTTISCKPSISPSRTNYCSTRTSTYTRRWEKACRSQSTLKSASMLWRESWQNMTFLFLTKPTSTCWTSW